MAYQRTPTYSATRRASQNWNRNQNTAQFKSSVKLGPVAHTVIVALMITVLGLIYLTQATKATSYDYQASELDAKIAELDARKSEMEVQNARLTALETVKASNVAKAMTQPSDVSYTE
ncbi:hypothetical protein FJZ39_02760 [Candidatus Saccharibacteria bacterium]|nr:hypothetical protein [Candidatus Saccharibacteria bacterium]